MLSFTTNTQTFDNKYAVLIASSETIVSFTTDSEADIDIEVGDIHEPNDDTITAVTTKIATIKKGTLLTRINTSDKDVIKLVSTKPFNVKAADDTVEIMGIISVSKLKNVVNDIVTTFGVPAKEFKSLFGIKNGLVVAELNDIIFGLSSVYDCALLIGPSTYRLADEEIKSAALLFADLYINTSLLKEASLDTSASGYYIYLNKKYYALSSLEIELPYEENSASNMLLMFVTLGKLPAACPEDMLLEMQVPVVSTIPTGFIGVMLETYDGKFINLLSAMQHDSSSISMLIMFAKEIIFCSANYKAKLSMSSLMASQFIQISKSMKLPKITFAELNSYDAKKMTQKILTANPWLKAEIGNYIIPTPKILALAKLILGSLFESESGMCVPVLLGNLIPGVEMLKDNYEINAYSVYIDYYPIDDMEYHLIPLFTSIESKNTNLPSTVVMSELADEYEDYFSYWKLADDVKYSDIILLQKGQSVNLTNEDSTATFNVFIIPSSLRTKDITKATKITELSPNSQYTYTCTDNVIMFVSTEDEYESWPHYVYEVIGTMTIL